MERLPPLKKYPPTEEHYTSVPIFNSVYSCLPMFMLVCLCLPLFTRVYLCFLMFTYVCSCLPMFSRVYLCLLVLTYVYSFLHKCKNLLGKNETIGLWIKWQKQGYRIDNANHNADHYITLITIPILHCNWALHPNIQCRIGLISEVIVIKVI